jgi:cystathionine beta-lyase
MNFDEHIDRNQYPALKWSKSFLAQHYGNEDAIPMSVADMDLKAPPSVIEHLLKRVRHGIFGYESKPDSFFTAFESWFQTRHDWKLERQHVEPCPSVLNAISILISQHSNEGDGVVLQSPVFFEFRKVVHSNGRKIVKNPLEFIDGHYQIDFDDLETKAAVPNNKILVLCNPHNPVGRVWTKAELEQVAAICVRHDVFVIADEIHGDFAFPPHRYIPFLTVSEIAAQNAAACISPAKTFNIAGMVDAIAIIPNETHRKRFREFTRRFQINKTNVFTSVAIEIGYRDGADWLDALLLYLQGNVALIKESLQAQAVPVSMVNPEGTFLVWLDFRELGLDAKALERFLAEKAELALSQGYWFGREGAGFARMTIACPRTTIKRSLANLAAATKGRS